MELANYISEWIKEKVGEARAEGIVLGLSGGVDSSLTAALAKKALGDKVLGLLMPCHSDPTDLEHARLVAIKFDIETEYVDLGPVFDSLMASLPKGSDLAVANLKPRLRMATLYYFANNCNYLVAGTGNKSEITIGYFTKFGDGGADLLPLGNLLKCQVRELATYPPNSSARFWTASRLAWVSLTMRRSSTVWITIRSAILAFSSSATP